GAHVRAEGGELPARTVERKPSELPGGTTRVEPEGVEGSRVTTYRTTYADGEVLDRQQLTSVVGAQPVDEVVLVGTGTVSAGSSGSSGSSGSGSSGSGGSTPQPVTYSGGNPRAIAQEMLAAYGWGSDQWSCLDRLWQRESNWNPYAQYP